MANVVSVAGLGLLTGGFLWFNADMAFPGAWALVPVLGVALTIAAGPDAWLNRALLSQPLAVWFGLISYPLYLWHWPELSFSEMTFTHVKDPARAGLTTVAVALAWLTYRFIEAPVRLGKPRMAWRTASIAAGPGVIGMLGYATHAGDGLPWGWRASRAGVAGDTDYDNFRRYTAAHYHACTL